MITNNLVSAATNQTNTITGEAVTGKATTQGLNINITVVTTGPPTLTIKAPKNKTYLSMQDFRIEIETNANNAWYNFNNGNNQTFGEYYYTHENMSFQGSHTLYIFANNSHGTTKKSVTFNINISLFNISYSDYSNYYKGNSTNLYEIPFEELQNYSNLILEHTNFGKILFNDLINLTNDYNPNDNFIDIDRYINITSNKVYVDSQMLPNFNKSATLIFYNLTLNTPRISKDGVVCPESICKINYYTSGTLSFNVSHFTSYEAEEAPSTGTSLVASPTSTTSESGGRRRVYKNITTNETNETGELLSPETKEVDEAEIKENRVKLITKEEIEKRKSYTFFILIGTLVFCVIVIVVSLIKNLRDLKKIK